MDHFFAAGENADLADGRQVDVRFDSIPAQHATDNLVRRALVLWLQQYLRRVAGPGKALYDAFEHAVVAGSTVISMRLSVATPVVDGQTPMAA